jgi:hypothetical protein
VARLLSILILFFAMQSSALHARNNSPRSKANQRFLAQCDAGSGLACFNYGRAQWGAGNQKLGKHYLSRACELKYKLACDTLADHSTTTRRYHNTKDGGAEICFSNDELSTARFTPNAISKSGTSGQKIDMIKSNSFWARAQLRENDILVRVNNMPFNNQKETLRAFSASGKTFGFEVIRDGETITLWYTCQ